jgi:hypothetical protein
MQGGRPAAEKAQCEKRVDKASMDLPDTPYGPSYNTKQYRRQRAMLYLRSTLMFHIHICPSRAPIQLTASPTGS